MPVGVCIGIRRQVALCPQSGSNTLVCRVIRKLFQVLHVRRYRRETLLRTGPVRVDAACHVVAILSVTCPVTVIRQEIAERHVVVQVLIQDIPR